MLCQTQFSFFRLKVPFATPRHIYDQLLKPIDSSLQENYDIFMKLIQETKNTHFPKKTVNFNQKKHNKSKWMTYDILNSINKTICVASLQKCPHVAKIKN